MLISEVNRTKFLLRLPKIPGGPFTGTGDLCAAMILALTDAHPLEAPEALERTGACLQAVISETVRLSGGAREMGGVMVPPELRLVESKRLIEEVPIEVRCQLLDPPVLRA